MLILRPWKLVTADIAYRMPDYLSVLQTLIWQDFDLMPELPALRKYLRFWEENLDGPVHSVRIVSAEIIESPRIAHRHHELRLH